ncbi:hypothetical protein C8R45DRAFT_1090432 [Mycena sanguinolenta]|nr:hypothetical protein C8R45DRAFT_1090432 [Mycena sanguinolenta]
MFTPSFLNSPPAWSEEMPHSLLRRASAPPYTPVPSSIFAASPFGRTEERSGIRESRLLGAQRSTSAADSLRVHLYGRQYDTERGYTYIDLRRAPAQSSADRPGKTSTPPPRSGELAIKEMLHSAIILDPSSSLAVRQQRVEEVVGSAQQQCSIVSADMKFRQEFCNTFDDGPASTSSHIICHRAQAHPTESRAVSALTPMNTQRSKLAAVSTRSCRGQISRT